MDTMDCYVQGRRSKFGPAQEWQALFTYGQFTHAYFGSVSSGNKSFNIQNRVHCAGHAELFRV